MNKKLLIYLTIVGMLSFFNAEVFTEEVGEETLRFNYHFEDPIISSSGEFQCIKISGLKQYRSEGAPVLPCKTLKILLPYGRTYSSVNVTTSPMREVKGNYLIEPGQSSFISQTELILPNPQIYSSTVPYPDEVFKVVTLQNKRGYRILYVNLFPVRYIPAQRMIAWCQEIEVEVSTRSAPVASGYRGLAKDRKMIAGQVSNPGIAESYILKAQ